MTMSQKRKPKETGRKPKKTGVTTARPLMTLSITGLMLFSTGVEAAGTIESPAGRTLAETQLVEGKKDFFDAGQLGHNMLTFLSLNASYEVAKTNEGKMKSKCVDCVAASKSLEKPTTVTPAFDPWTKVDPKFGTVRPYKDHGGNFCTRNLLAVILQHIQLGTAYMSFPEDGLFVPHIFYDEDSPLFPKEGRRDKEVKMHYKGVKATLKALWLAKAEKRYGFDKPEGGRVTREEALERRSRMPLGEGATADAMNDFEDEFLNPGAVKLYELDLNRLLDQLEKYEFSQGLFISAMWNTELLHLVKHLTQGPEFVQTADGRKLADPDDPKKKNFRSDPEGRTHFLGLTDARPVIGSLFEMKKFDKVRGSAGERLPTLAVFAVHGPHLHGQSILRHIERYLPWDKLRSGMYSIDRTSGSSASFLQRSGPEVVASGFLQKREATQLQSRDLSSDGVESNIPVEEPPLMGADSSSWPPTPQVWAPPPSQAQVEDPDASQQSNQQSSDSIKTWTPNPQGSDEKVTVAATASPDPTPASGSGLSQVPGSNFEVDFVVVQGDFNETIADLPGRQTLRIPIPGRDGNAETVELTRGDEQNAAPSTWPGFSHTRRYMPSFTGLSDAELVTHLQTDVFDNASPGHPKENWKPDNAFHGASKHLSEQMTYLFETQVTPTKGVASDHAPMTAVLKAELPSGRAAGSASGSAKPDRPIRLSKVFGPHAKDDPAGAAAVAAGTPAVAAPVGVGALGDAGESGRSGGGAGAAAVGWTAQATLTTPDETHGFLGDYIDLPNPSGKNLLEITKSVLQRSNFPKEQVHDFSRLRLVPSRFLSETDSLRLAETLQNPGDERSPLYIIEGIVDHHKFKVFFGWDTAPARKGAKEALGAGGAGGRAAAVDDLTKQQLSNNQANHDADASPIFPPLGGGGGLAVPLPSPGPGGLGGGIIPGIGVGAPYLPPLGGGGGLGGMGGGGGMGGAGGMGGLGGGAPGAPGVAGSWHCGGPSGKCVFIHLPVTIS